MSSENKALVRRWIEEMDKHNFEPIDEILSADFKLHFPGNPEPMKLNEYKQFIHSLYESFPDARHKIEDLIAEGDRVVVRVTDCGTHKGNFMGVAPTDVEVNIGSIVIYRFVEGKCVEAWQELDLLGLMQQLGAIPS